MIAEIGNLSSMYDNYCKIMTIFRHPTSQKKLCSFNGKAYTSLDENLIRLKHNHSLLGV